MATRRCLGGFERRRQSAHAHLPHCAPVDHPPEGEAAGAQFAAQLQREIHEIDAILNDLVLGDPKRPLFIPRDIGIPGDVDAGQPVASAHPAHTRWHRNARAEYRQTQGISFDPVVEDFVSRINSTVLKMEVSYGKSIDVLRNLRILLIVLAVIGTIVLLRFLQSRDSTDINPLAMACAGSAKEDFTIRVPVRTQDELGKLAKGFNTMAGHLESLYTTLEERVDDKTRTLTSKNKELEILYAVGAFLRANRC